MARRNPPARWFLPEVVDPVDTLCVTVPVPNEPYHRAAFMGAMLSLARAFNWSNDESHTAIDVANVWDRIYQGLSYVECGEPIYPVPIQESEYEMSVCEQLRFQNGRLQGLCCGEWTDIDGQQGSIPNAGTQPPPGGDVEPGTCQQFNLAIQGNQRVLLPVQVDDGYIITISAAQGGWFDGNPLHAWQCPSGQTYALGACVSAGPTDAGSPIPALPTGRLIAEVGAATLDAYNTVIVVPNGTGPTDMFLQMNDATLTDNQGSITVTVEVCQNAEITAGTITYFTGSGPSSYQEGDIIQLSSASNGTDQHIDWQFSRCTKFTVVSSTGFVPYSYGVARLYDWFDCAAVFHNGPLQTSGSTPTQWPASTETLRIAFGGDNGSPWSMALRIDEVQ